MENKHKHLEFIERSINRMSNTSFLLKGWCITILVGVLALASNTGRIFIFISYVSTVVFWVLDSYYLYQERQFRWLYDKVRLIKDDDDIDFSMDLSGCPQKGTSKFFKTMLAKVEWIFYLTLIDTLIIVTILLFI